MNKKTAVFAVVGAHNSGKTTFIENVIKILKQKGYKVVAIKHDPKGKAKIDTEGKDSWKFQQAGADEVLLVSPNKITTFTRTEEELHPFEIIKNYTNIDADFIILEGFKWYKGFDKYEVIRKEENRELILKDSPELKGVITDYYKFFPSFDINKPEEFVKFIEKNY